MIKFKDLDNAIIGLTDDIVSGTQRFVYDYNKCVETLMKQGNDEQSAIDWIDYNVLGSYLGKETPIIVYQDAKHIEKDINSK